MGDVRAQAERVRSSLSEPRWDRDREQQILEKTLLCAGNPSRSTRQKLAATGMLAVATVLLAIFGGAAWRSSMRALHSPAASVAALVEQPVPPSPVSPPPVSSSGADTSSPAPAHDILLQDGSSARLLGQASVVRVETDSPSLTRLALLSGGAHFNVKSEEPHRFRIEADTVSLQVGGTFLVEYVEPNSVQVTVEEGRVLAEHPLGATTLGPHETAIFPRAISAPAARATAEGGPRSRWRALAKQGQYAAAYDAMKAQGSADIPDEPQALLLAADVARKSGHPRDATAPLQRLLAKHRSDPRASAAAFTLGRVYLEDLNKPEDAARLFAEARGLDHGGSLIEDALAREVEAYAKAAQGKQARDRAALFEHLFPNSPRLVVVRRLAGME